MTDSKDSSDQIAFNRRAFLGTSAVALTTLVGTGSALASPNTKRPPREEPVILSAKKQWAKTQLRGGESFILPSLMPDLKTPDEEGLRRDVRHSIANGLCSILPLTTGLDAENARLMERIVADEAKGKIFVVGLITPGSWEDVASRVRYMQELGTSHVLMYFNPALPSQDAMVEQMLTVINNTSLAIILYAKPSAEITHLDPTGLPLDAFDKLAEHDNVVGVKFTQSLRPATAYAVAERLGDRLLMGVVDLELMLPLSLKHKMQWTGQWAIESLQSPDQPWVTQFLALLREGKDQKAYELYWRYEPIASSFYALQLPPLSIGGHPWIHIKYMKWLTGGNGGLMSDLHESPEYVPHLDAEGRAQCRAIFAKVGIKTVDLPDEAFIVGNAAYERGVRAKDLASLPQYSV